MVEEGTCSQCGDTFDPRAFNGHNHHVHDGNADLRFDDADADRADADRGDAGTAESFDAASDELEGDADAGDVSDSLGEETDERDYHCGKCGESVPYLGGDENPEGPGKVCPECGTRLLWSQL